MRRRASAEQHVPSATGIRRSPLPASARRSATAAPYTVGFHCINWRFRFDWHASVECVDPNERTILHCLTCMYGRYSRVAVKTALVLSAGGMFGAYQAGAWRELSASFRPDLVVGTSAGSLNGWSIAGGCPPE